VLVLSVNLEDGDLPLRIAFPVMIKNAIEFFLGGKGELRPAVATGQAMTVPMGAVRKSINDLSSANAGKHATPTITEPAENALSLVLRSPKGTWESLSSSSEQVSVGPFDEVGLWWVGPEAGIAQTAEPSFEDDAWVPIAVNLANPNESDLRPRIELSQAPPVSVVWGGHSLWFYLTLGATLGICLEWILYQRRIVA
jgi:hypothetical protein